MNQIIIDQANSSADLDVVRELFREYAASLEISLCFQNFEQELSSLPGKYALPAGRLFLAHSANDPCGCVALRSIDRSVCEMKRLYVRPAWRQRGLGRDLALKIIGAAREIGYDCMRLDTLSSMKSAISLYRSLGFRDITPYYDNPSDRAVFMELLLGDSEHPCGSLGQKVP